MNVASMKEILGIAHKSQNAVHMIGEAGIGKTEIVKQFAKEMGYHVEVLQLTVMDTGDLMGMPDIYEKDGERVTSWAKPIWLQRINQANKDGKHCVVFLDELGRASEDIRQASLQMVLEGKIQEHSLGELDALKSLLVVADNPSENYDSAEFDQALEDRFITLEVTTSVDSWLKYARTRGLEPVITDYVAEYPDKLLFKPEDTSEKGSTPRAWEALSRILVHTPKNSPVLFSLIEAKVGKVVGANFYQFFQNYIDIIKPEDIVDAIGDVPLNTVKQQKTAAKKLQKMTKKIEAIAAVELAEKIKDLCIQGLVDVKMLVVYIASLNFEIGTSIAKSWKEEGGDSKEFFIKDFMNAQPDKWYITELWEASRK
jgi:alkaline phosphatase D